MKHMKHMKHMKSMKRMERMERVDPIEQLNNISDTLGNMSSDIYNGGLSDNLDNLDNLAGYPHTRDFRRQNHLLVGGQSDATSPDSLGGILSSRINNVVNSFFKAFVNLADNFIPVFSQAAFGNLADVPYQEIAPELQKNKQLIEFIMNDPITKQAFKELIKTYIDFLIELYKLNEAEINQLQDTFWEGINEFARRSGTGLSNSALNFIETALAEIPVVGGIIDLVISIMRGFNHFMLASSPIIEQSLKGAATAQKMRNDVNEFFSNNSEKLQQSMDKFNMASQGLNQRLSEPFVPSTRLSQFKGGKNKKKKKQIKKTLKRIYNSISRFTRRRRY